eukprot:GEZU01015614.1.p1 GENE.GEZU01015614.1~~GEZU01015614.1.p1  ORF type:complete len:205 (+),score=63.81 GEZU01015614.1:95-709(+)
MKLFSIAVLKWKGLPEDKEPVILSAAFDLSSFGFFQRGSVKEFAIFLSRTLAKRTQPGTRQQVEQNEYFCYVHSRTNGIAVALIADAEYPSRVAFSLCSKVLQDFTDKYSGRWEDDKYNTDYSLPYPDLEPMLQKYQNPSEADSIMKIQKELDETKTIMHQAIENVLERGEKIDNLVEKSTDISMASKAFYTSAKKQNSCCIIQ